MDAELIVVSGAHAGTRFPLGKAEFTIGRAANSSLPLDGAGIALEHCAVCPAGGGYRLVDRHSGAGTYVNGLRVTDHALAADDEISIGETTLIFREAQAERESDARHTLLQACGLLFLFRALASARDEQRRHAFDGQLLALLQGVLPCSGGAILLGHDEAALRAAIADPASTAAVPIWAHGKPAGLLLASFPPEELVNLAQHQDTLGAIATIAAAAFETERDVEHLRTENSLLRERLSVTEPGIAGESIAIHKLLALVARVAPQDASVLILGESGVGKELVARALHRLSPRVQRPFVAINCAALTETLLESELFGHEKGAFTGAVAQKKGKLEMAEGGTIFLDEIGELAPPLQAKLLRVLQQREFERVGGTHTWKLDVRLVAATNRDLAAEVQRGGFREDLYHRLNVVALRVPALRERPGDILHLARYFLDRAASRCGRAIRGFSPEAEACLMAYTWPGNVRELENAVERAVVLGESEWIQPEDLPDTVLDSGAVVRPPGALQTSVVDTKRQSILTAWRQAGGDHERTAELLHIHPNSLRRLIRTLKLRDAL
ncbi:MAG: sigma54 specific transcriptional regulator, Fis family [Candidatus Solibacter sp.]|nr:sigma54 specific transcriptional regulator, Fis family [Candidatus Solibacter sp.]